VQTRVAVALARLASDDRLRSALAWTLRQTAQPHETLRLVRLHAVPGLGTLWRLGLRDALHAITRCPRVQALVSSCRLVKGAKESAGKRDGTAGKKSGHAYLTWAFAGAAALLLRHKTQGQKLLAHVEKKHGQGKALPILAPKLARAVYYMLTRATVFEMARFRNGYGSRVGEPATALDTYGISLYYRPGQSATALRHGTRTRP
jgi:transposase